MSGVANEEMNGTMGGSMGEPAEGHSSSLLLRFARWQMRALVRMWPEESRRWGQALASEVEEIERPLEAAFWAVGGVTVFLRAMASHLFSWLNLPVGARSGAGPGSLMDAPKPKRSRLFATVTLVGAFALLLFVPGGREAIVTLSAMWSDFRQSEADRQAVDRAAARAEKENDANTMAFAAMSLHRTRRGVELAERAVAQDPRLVWIYARQGRNSDRDFEEKPEWLAKLQAADPDNAVPYLFAADAIAERHLTGLYDRRSPSEKEIEDILTRDAQWIALMHRAFHAKHYDGYYYQHTELNREVWNRNPNLTFSSVMVGLWAHPIPNLMRIGIFARLLIRQAEEQRAAGRLEEAEELLKEGQGFSDLMQRDSVDIVSLIGLNLQRKVALGWQSFYERTGHSTEAQAEAQRVALLDQRFQDFRERRMRYRDTGHRKSAWIVEISAILTVIATLAGVLSIGLFEVRPGIWGGKPISRRVLCRMADLAPPTALAACLAFLLGFLPYARLLTAFRSGGPGAPDEQQISQAFWSLLSVAQTMAGPDSAVTCWTVLTVFLSLLAVAILARMVYRALGAPAQTSA